MTVAVFLSQVSSDDHSCRGAVARLLAWRVARGLPACSPDAGGYCKARQRLPEALLPRLVRDTADRLGDHAPEGWLFHGRRVVLADGSTVSMPDTPENQAAYPQHAAPEARLRLPDRPDRRADRAWPPAACSTRPSAPARGSSPASTPLLRSLHGRLRRGDILLADATTARSTR